MSVVGVENGLAMVKNAHGYSCRASNLHRLLDLRAECCQSLGKVWRIIGSSSSFELYIARVEGNMVPPTDQPSVVQNCFHPDGQWDEQLRKYRRECYVMYAAF